MGGGHSTFDPRSPAPADGTFQRTPIVSVRGRLRPLSIFGCAIAFLIRIKYLAIYVNNRGVCDLLLVDLLIGRAGGR